MESRIVVKVIAVVFILAHFCDLSAQNCTRKSIAMVETEIQCPQSDWQVLFSDNFDGNRLDTTFWSTETGNPAPADRTLFPSKVVKGKYIQTPEAQYYSDRNVLIGDGLCTIHTKKENFTYKGSYEEAHDCTSKKDKLCGDVGDPFKYKFKYTSGILRLKNGFQATEHLKIDARIKLPEVTGLFPAFWSFSGKEELDFFEIFGSPEDGLHSGIIEWNKGKKESYCQDKKMPFPYDGYFHDYTIEVTPYWMKIYVDGELRNSFSKYVTIDNDDNVTEYDVCGSVIPAGEVQELDCFPDSETYFNVIINAAVYSWVRKSQLPCKLEIDHVKIYGKDYCGSERSDLIVDHDLTLNQWNPHEYKNITVAANKTLNIFHTNVAIAEGGKVVLEKGATIKLGNGSISAACGPWQGIIAKENSKVIFVDDSSIDQAVVAVDLMEFAKIIVEGKNNSISNSLIGIQERRPSAEKSKISGLSIVNNSIPNRSLKNSIGEISTDVFFSILAQIPR